MNTETKYEVRPVVGYEGLYSVSNDGRVFSHNYNHTGKTRELKSSKDNYGYLQLELWRDGKGKNHKVHRLVLEAFVPNPDNKPQCDHIDANKANNQVSNLRWATAKENRNNPITKEQYIGQKRSEEFCRKMSAIRKGKTLSDETRRKISAARQGKKHSDETRRKISASLKGKTQSEKDSGIDSIMSWTPSTI